MDNMSNTYLHSDRGCGAYLSTLQIGKTDYLTFLQPSEIETKLNKEPLGTYDRSGAPNNRHRSLQPSTLSSYFNSEKRVGNINPTVATSTQQQ